MTSSTASSRRGGLTASSSNGQPWHFVVVRDRDTRRKLGEALSGNGPYLADAPLAIAVVVNRSAPAVSDASRAIQSMLLAAWADGVGGNWVGSVRTNGPARPILGIPDDQDIPAVLALGYPAQPVGKGQKNRKPAKRGDLRRALGPATERLNHRERSVHHPTPHGSSPPVERCAFSP